MNAEETKILVVDDEQGIRDLLSYELLTHGYLVETAPNGEEAVAKIRRDKFQLAIMDLKMPKKDGIETLEIMKGLDPDLEVIMATGFGTIPKAVEAMKKGAYDFIQKPFNLDEIFAVIHKALERSEMKAIIGVYEISKAIFSSLNPDVLFGLAVQSLQKILRIDDASLVVFDENGVPTMAAAHGLDDEPGRLARIEIARRAASCGVKDGNPVLIVGPLRNDPCFHDMSGVEEIGHSVIYPLMLQETVLGVLSANRRSSGEPFIASERRNFTILSAQMAQALANSRTYEKLDQKIAELEAAYRELEETQAELVQAEKLAAIGRLTAGLAHELNNPLTSILGFAELLLESESLTEEQVHDLQIIEQEVDRCRQIILNLLQFSRKTPPRLEPVLVVDVLRRTLDLVAYEFTTSQIAVTTRFPDLGHHDYPSGGARDGRAPLPSVMADPVQLQQVFLNLLTNARQAFNGQHPPPGERRVEVMVEEREGEIAVSVTDNGCGIPVDCLEKVFEPFFTTKPAGEGTGLGLSVSHGIIQEYGGTLSVQSTVGGGSTFTARLPISHPCSPGGTPMVSPGNPLPSAESGLLPDGLDRRADAEGRGR